MQNEVGVGDTYFSIGAAGMVVVVVVVVVGVVLPFLIGREIGAVGLIRVEDPTVNYDRHIQRASR